MLKNKNIVIFGGGGLIGRSLTISAIQNGATVTAAGRSISRDDFPDLESDTKNNLHLANVDISNEESIDTFFEALLDGPRPVDAIVNCAFPRSGKHGVKFEDIKYEDFCENIRLQQGSVFLACQKAASYFEQQGRGNIINVSSIYGIMAPRFEIYEGTLMTKELEYILSKSAIVHFTRYLAKYLKGKNIRVNCVSPGGVFNDEQDVFLEKYNQHCMNKGMLDSGDVVGTFLYLLSDHSKHLNGQNIIIDDGFSL